MLHAHKIVGHVPFGAPLSLNLPRPAFLPSRILSDEERHDFVMRRDRLFALCTPSEQQRLLMLAQWIGAHDPPASGFVAELETLQAEGEADVVFGVVHFLRMVPVQVGIDAQRESLKQELTRLAASCAEDARVPAARRFAAIQRCALWSRVTGLAHDVHDVDLHTWRQLLALLQEDAASAVHVVDAWDRRTSPHVFNELSLRQDPQLAHRLAVALRPHRPDVAAALLGDSVFHASFQHERLQGNEPALGALQRAMDASCALLAEWTLTAGLLGTDAAMAALQNLFRFGDPAQPYWRRLPQQAMALLAAEHPHAVPTLACVAFYAPAESTQKTMALELLEHRLRRLTADAATVPLAWTQLPDFLQSTQPLLDERLLSGRNRRVPAQPDHELHHIVDRAVNDLMRQVATELPEQVLGKRVQLVQTLDSEALIRKHHQLLRGEFEALAQDHPGEAGLAMKRLIQYCAYSQLDDEMYKRDLCSESFHLLLPTLEAISPADAAIAREGIDWDLREQGFDWDD